ncbi:hypothetical protein X801_05125, partial [Opisthorchis viverrini]
MDLCSLGRRGLRVRRKLLKTRKYGRGDVRRGDVPDARASLVVICGSIGVSCCPNPLFCPGVDSLVVPGFVRVFDLDRERRLVRNATGLKRKLMFPVGFFFRRARGDPEIVCERKKVVAIKIAKSVVDKDGRTQTTVVSPADPVTSFHIYEKCCFDRRAFDTCASRQKPICRRRYEDLRLVDALRLHNSDFKSPLTKMLGSSSSRHIQSS